jgi:hypothetical protein
MRSQGTIKQLRPNIAMASWLSTITRLDNRLIKVANGGSTRSDILKE